MLIIKRKFFKEIWFATEKKKHILPVIYKQILGENKENTTEKFTTLIIDLSQNEDEILNKFEKDTKYEIRRAVKENIIFEKFENKFKFREAYNKMSKILNINKITNERLESFGNNLVITRAIYNGNDVIYHAYLCDDKRARLLYSVRNLNENIENKIYGFANRFLHSEDIKYFKKIGKQIYDFGGIANGKNEKTNNIDRFKYSFGGTIKQEENYMNFTMKILMYIRRVTKW